MAFNFFKSAFERFSIENQQAAVKYMRGVYEYFTQDELNTITLGLSSLDNKLDILIKSQDELKTVFSELIRGEGDLVDKDRLKLLGVTSRTFGKSLDIIVNAVKVFSMVPEGAVERLISGIERIAEKFGDFSDDGKAEAFGMTLNKVSNAILFFGLKMILAAPVYAVALPASFLVVGALSVFVWLFNTLLGNKRVYKNVQRATDTLNEISTAVLLFGLKMTLATPLFLIALVGSIIIVPTLLIYTILFNKLLGNRRVQKNVVQGAIALAVMGAAVLLFGAFVAMTALMFRSVEWEDLAKIGAAVAGIGLVMALAGKFFAQIMLGSLALILASIPLIMIAFAMKIWKSADIGWEDIGMVGATIAMIGIEFGLIGIPVVAGLIAIGSLALITAAGALILLSVGIKAFINSGADKLDPGILGSVLSSIAEGFNSVGFISAGKAAAKAAIFATIGMSMVPLSLGLKVFKNVGWRAKDTESLEHALIGVGGTFSAIGSEKYTYKSYNGDTITISPKDVAKGVASVFFMGGVLKNIAKGVRAWAELGLTTEESTQIANNIDQIVGLVSASFGRIGARGTDGIFGGITAFLYGSDALSNPSENWTASDVARGIDSVDGMGRILKNLAEGVAAWANLDNLRDKNGNKIVLDYEAISMNIDKVLTVVSASFARIGAMSKPGTLSIGGVSISGLWQSNDVEKGVQAVSGLGEILVNLASGVQTFHDLNNLKDKDGNPIPFDPDLIASNIETILTTVSRVFGKIGKDDLFGGDGGIDPDDVEDGIEALEGMGSLISQLGQGAKDFSEIGNPLALGDSIHQFIRHIADNFSDEKLTGDTYERFDLFINNVETLANSASKMEKIADNFERIAKSTDDFKDSINDLELERLEHVSNMFGFLDSMSSQSSGQFMRNVSDAIEDGIRTLVEVTREIGSSAQATQQVVQQVVTTTASGEAGATVDMTPVVNQLAQIARTNSRAYSALQAIQDQLEGTLKVEVEEDF